MTQVSTGSSHVSYHAEGIRASLANLISKLGCLPDLVRALRSSSDMEWCASDSSAVAMHIMEYAKDEERMLGPRADTWRSAAKALHEIGLRGPCLTGDQEYAKSQPTARFDRTSVVAVPRSTLVVNCGLDYKTQMVSHDAELAFRLSMSECIGLYPWDWMPSISDTGGKERIRRAFDGEVTIVDSLPFTTTSGVYGYRKVRVGPWYDENGEIAGAQATMRLLGSVKQAT